MEIRLEPAQGSLSGRNLRLFLEPPGSARKIFVVRGFHGHFGALAAALRGDSKHQNQAEGDKDRDR